MPKYLVKFYEDLGDEMPGPYRAITINADDEEGARIETGKLHKVSKFYSVTDLDEADRKSKASYYENECGMFGPFNGD